MVNTRWPRLWDGPNRRWRSEAQAAAPVPAPRLFRREDTNGEAAERPRGGAQAVRVLFINQYYWPDHASTAQHLADLAESLAAEGFECHVVCSRGGYRPGLPRLPKHEIHRGVHIHRVGATALGRKSTLARMTDYLSFYAQAVARAVLLPRFDVVVTLTTPPIIGLAGTILRRLKKTKHVYWSMDLHPDASLALGRMSARNPVVGALAHLSRQVYRRADKVVALGPYMADRVAAKGVRSERLVTIPVWSRADQVGPRPRASNPLRERLGLGDAFVAMYSGNVGLAHRFDEIIEAARRLRERSDIVFLFVGDGPRLQEVRRAKEEYGLENLRILPYFAREDLRDSLSLADVHLVTMRTEMAGIVVPGKLYGAMAAGRPVLFVGPAHCETADTIRATNCGRTIRPHDTDGLVEALTLLASDPELAECTGAAGRAAFEESFEREVCCTRWLETIGELTGQPAPAPAIAAPAIPAPHVPLEQAASRRPMYAPTATARPLRT